MKNKMKFNKVVTLALGALLAFNISCSNDEDVVVDLPKGDYEKGILIANEGGFSSPNASVTYISNDFSVQSQSIFSTNNSNALLGNVFQSIGFKGDNAYLVTNVPNKIEVVNRYTFKKNATITANLETPRYIAFNGSYTYVTNNDFFSVRKVNIYDQSNAFVKSINFDRYAEKIASADAYVYVQTDGVTYDTSYNEIATGHSITRINATTNVVDKTITLPDTYILRDLLSDGSNILALTSNGTGSTLYRIDGKTGTYTQSQFTGVLNAKNLTYDNGRIYFLAGKKVFEVSGSTATAKFDVEGSYIYGFNVIDGNVFVSDASFSKDSTVRIYSNSGNLLKTITAGIGTNGFYKN